MIFTNPADFIVLAGTTRNQRRTAEVDTDYNSYSTQFL